MPVRRWRTLLSLCIASVAVITATGCAAQPSSELGYLKTLQRSHELDAKAVQSCTQGYSPKPKPLAAQDSTLRSIRKLMSGSAQLSHDPILSSNRQGYASICILKSTDNGRSVTVAEYHLTPPHGSGGADGGGILEW